jgi:hypothetical protein
MPINTALATKVWVRYCWSRDNGHTKFVEKVDRCERFFAGDQWEQSDINKLKLARRPALTINKIISTVSNVMGEQIYNRAEIGFQPRSGAPQEIANTLAKVFKQISDNNQLEWKRSDMFADGIIGSRGFLDVRLGFKDSMQGEVEITNLNSKNVIIDPDGEEYEPGTWNEVFITKWCTADDIAILYNPADAEMLRNREQSFFPYGYDSISSTRDRFGTRINPMYSGDHEMSSVLRNIRVIERQHRMLDRQKHFMSPETGDMRPIPADFPRDKIAWFVEKYGFQVTTKLVKRIRWTVIADNFELHDDWSPYKHFTVVPYFPYFRKGNTIGLVENLLGSQELLNKTSSQELHIVNTTANSGWMVQSGGLTNMTPEDLETRGAETGLVVETNGPPREVLEKITPNAVPTGLDRISYKAEDHIKTISGVSDYMTGQAREDVAAKAIDKNKQSGATGLAKPLDNLRRSDTILATVVLDLVQEHYTEHRLMTITNNRVTDETETFSINEVTPEGTIANDLTVGEYGVIVTSVPQRETMEDSQFDQAVAMREMGVMIPDSVLIDNSRLQNKKEIIKLMEGDKESPEAQAQAELQRRAQEAEVAKAEAEGAAKGADAGLKKAKADKTVVETQVLANTPIEDPNAGAGGNPELEMAQAEHEADLEERKFEHEQRLDMMKLGMERQKQDNELRLKAQDMAIKRTDQRAAQQAQAAAAAQKPSTLRQGTR